MSLSEHLLAPTVTNKTKQYLAYFATAGCSRQIRRIRQGREQCSSRSIATLASALARGTSWRSGDRLGRFEDCLRTLSPDSIKTTYDVEATADEFRRNGLAVEAEPNA